MSVFEIMQQILVRLGAFVETIFSFMTYTISVPFLGDFSILALLGGAGLVIFLVAGIVNKLSPL